MTTTNSQIRQKALGLLKGRWGAAILTSFIYFAIVAAIGSIPTINIFSFLITIPIGYGMSIWFLNFLRSEVGKEPEISTIFDGFKDYARIFITIFLTNLYAVLWGLLLIVPGIIKALSYALTPYILKDYPELKNNEAIELSMAMMKGHKMQLLLMALNFTMWSILSIFTLCIALLWIIPYMEATMAAFYEEVKRDYESRKIATVVE